MAQRRHGEKNLFRDGVRGDVVESSNLNDQETEEPKSLISSESIEEVESNQTNPVKIRNSEEGKVKEVIQTAVIEARKIDQTEAKQERKKESLYDMGKYGRIHIQRELEREKREQEKTLEDFQTALDQKNLLIEKQDEKLKALNLRVKELEEKIAFAKSLLT